MRLTIVHLSDIHFRHDIDKEGVVGKVEGLARAALAAASESKAIVLVVAGDIANSGKAIEYTCAQLFIEELCARINERIPKNCVLKVVVAPGNHDCNLEPASQPRQILLSGLKKALPEQPLDADTYKVILAPQVAFSAFQAGVHKEYPIESVSPVASKLRLIDTPFSADVWVVNSAWFSTNPETNQLLFPPHGQVSSNDADISIAVMHHPISWFDPMSAKRLVTFLEQTADIVLIGHEHESYWHAHERLKSSLFFLQGGVLQDHRDRSHSSFNVVNVDLPSGVMDLTVYKWSESQVLYRTAEQLESRPLQRNAGRLRRDFALSQTFERELASTDMPILHPRKSEVVLQDIYLLPDIRMVNGLERTNEKIPIVHDPLKRIFDSKEIALIGPHRSGKTSLAKVLFEELRRRDCVPVMLNGTKIGKQAISKFRKYIEAHLQNEYSEPSVDQFWQLDKNRRAVIIDDLQYCQLTSAERNEFFRILRDSCETIVVVGDDSLRMEKYGSTKKDNVLRSLPLYEIMPFGHVLQDRLISRWFALRDDDTDTSAPPEQLIGRIRHILPRFLANSGIPPYPAFLLTVLQLQEANNLHQIHEGSYGYLLQSMITQSLSKALPSSIEFDTALSLLSTLAFQFHKERRVTLTEQEFLSLCLDYQKKFRIKFSPIVLLQACKEAKVFLPQQDAIGFASRYHRYFFTAHYLASYISNNGVKEEIGRLCQRLHQESSANILMFVCYLTKDPFILDTIEKACTDLYSDKSPTELEKDCQFLRRLTERIPTLKFSDEPHQSRRLERLTQQDVDDEEEIDCWHFDRDDADDASFLEREYPDIARLNAYAKLMQILGQILRTFAGSIDGERKTALVSHAYKTARRVVKWFFDIVQTDLEGTAKEWSEATKKTHKKLLPSEVRERVSSMVFLGCFGVTCFSFNQVAQALGDDRLLLSLDDAKASDNSLSTRILDVAARLATPGVFPEKEVFALHEEIEHEPFLFEVLRFTVSMHEYLFDLDDALVARLRKRFDRKVEPPRLGGPESGSGFDRS